MPTLPDRAHSDHLKKQAKDLLRAYRSDDPEAITRFGRALPAAKLLSPAEIVARGFRLHDARSCIAREYGFASWPDMASHLEARSLLQSDRATRLRSWLGLVYGGDITGALRPAQPHVAARILMDDPEVILGDPYAACAAGHDALLLQTAGADPGWVNRPGGALKLPPLVAVTHSRLAQIPVFRDRLHRSAECLLRAGADPNQTFYNRFPPASLEAPDDKGPLSALYGAAGVNRDPALTKLLLDAGADPNDGESLYHSVENPECTRILLLHGAHVAGSNALRRSLDMTDAAALELLLANGGDPNEPAGAPPTSDWGAPLLRAIALRCSLRHIEALLAAGADPSARTPAGVSAYRLALQAGLPDVANALRDAGTVEPLSPEDEFIAACARGDAVEARRIQARRPDLPGSLPEAQLRLLPDTVAWGSAAAARVMVELGWPLDARGGDWKASALNHAVFRGDAELTRVLLVNGASWRDQHGHGDNVIGTLSWASLNEPVEDGDWAACARVLLDHGLPTARGYPADAETLIIDDRKMRFSEDAAEVLVGGDRVASD